MRRLSLLSVVVGVVLSLSIPAVSHAQDLRGEIEAIVKDYLAAHPEEVGEVVKSYFLKHPEAVGQILAELLKRRPTTSAGTPTASTAKPADNPAAVVDNAKLLFSSPHQVTLGNPHGNISLVEFFDYNCGYCKRALPDMLTLLKDDSKLKIVLKEFPILGPGSVDAARVAIAVRMQDPGGAKYLAFHKELLGGPGPASKEKALAAAEHQGLDMTRLQKDIGSDEVAATLSEDTKLASALGIHGTPGYVVGNNVVIGAVGLVTLQAKIDMARGAATK